MNRLVLIRKEVWLINRVFWYQPDTVYFFKICFCFISLPEKHKCHIPNKRDHMHHEQPYC